jgi:molybdenum cofactor cytidylyltransferase
VPSVNNKSVFAIVLAAGSASRFGSLKQLALFNGIPMVRHAGDLAIESCGGHCILVTGHEWRAVTESCAPWPGYLLVNEHYRNGIGSSLAAATRAIQHAADAIIVVLADQPMITSAHIKRLIATWSGAENEIVATAYAGVRGAPTLFAAACFPRLASLEGDRGARALFDDPGFVLREIECEDAAIDIDTEAELRTLERNARS